MSQAVYAKSNFFVSVSTCFFPEPFSCHLLLIRATKEKTEKEKEERRRQKNENYMTFFIMIFFMGNFFYNGLFLQDFL